MRGAGSLLRMTALSCVPEHQNNTLDRTVSDPNRGGAIIDRHLGPVLCDQHGMIR